MLDKKKEEFLRRGLWIKSHATQYLEELAQKEREEKYVELIEICLKNILNLVNSQAKA